MKKEVIEYKRYQNVRAGFTPNSIDANPRSQKILDLVVEFSEKNKCLIYDHIIAMDYEPSQMKSEKKNLTDLVVYVIVYHQ